MDIKSYVISKAEKIKATVKRGEIYVQGILVGALQWVTSPDNLKAINDQLPQLQQYAGAHLGQILGGVVSLLILYVHVAHTDPVTPAIPANDGVNG